MMGFIRHHGAVVGKTKEPPQKVRVCKGLKEINPKILKRSCIARQTREKDEFSG
jgi:hypothetical protein